MICGAALEGWGCCWSPSLTPALQVWFQQESLRWQDLLEVPDPTSWPKQGQLQTQTRSLKTPRVEIPQPLWDAVSGLHHSHGEMLESGGFLLKTRGDFPLQVTPCPPIEHLSSFSRELEGGKVHLPLPFHHSHTPSLSIKPVNT